jgi:hypothetical protein
MAFYESGDRIVELLKHAHGGSWIDSVKNAFSSTFWPTWESSSQGYNNQELRSFGAEVLAKLKADGQTSMEAATTMFLYCLDGVYNVVNMVSFYSFSINLCLGLTNSF